MSCFFFNLKTESEKVIRPLDVDRLEIIENNIIKGLDQCSKKVYISNFFQNTCYVKDLNLMCLPNMDELKTVIYEIIPKCDEKLFDKFIRCINSGKYQKINTVLSDIKSEVLINSLYDFCKTVSDSLMKV